MDDGVAFFDGVDWTEYHHVGGLWVENVTEIYVDSNNTKWFAGLGLISFDDSVWTYHPSDFFGFSALEADQNGDLWLGTRNSAGGLAKYDGANWIYYTLNNSNIPYIVINSIAVDHTNKKWVGTWGGGLILFDDSTWTVFDQNNSGIPSNDVWAVEVDNNNLLWIGTQSGLATFDGVTWTDINLYSNAGILSNFINSIHIAHNGTVYIGTDGGLAIFDGQNWHGYSISNTGLPRGAYRIAIDNSNNKWVGTWGKGLIKFDGSIWTVYNEANSGLPNNTISWLFISDINDKWIATYNGGIGVLNSSGWTVYNTSNSALPSEQIHCVTEDATGNYWVGTYLGMAKFDGINWTVYDTSNCGLPDNFVSTIAFDLSQSVWIGTQNGLTKFDGVNWTTYNTQNSGIPADNISSIYISDQNNIWLGTYQGGVAKFNGTSWTVYDRTNSPIPSNEVNYITADNQNVLWIGTDPYWNGNAEVGGGLAIFDGNNWAILDSSNSELPDNHVYSVAFDMYDNKWICTESGLSAYNANGVLSVDAGDEDNSPTDFSLLQNYPNPFNPVTKIPYQISTPYWIQLRIYNVLGQAVRTLVNAYKKPGSYEVLWDGKNDFGESVSTGIYIYQIQAGNRVLNKRMILIR